MLQSVEQIVQVRRHKGTECSGIVPVLYALFRCGLVLWVGLVLHRWPVIRDEETFAEQQLGSVTDAQVCKDRDEDDDYEDHEEEGLQASFHWFRI